MKIKLYYQTVSRQRGTGAAEFDCLCATFPISRTV